MISKAEIYKWLHRPRAQAFLRYYKVSYDFFEIYSATIDVLFLSVFMNSVSTPLIDDIILRKKSKIYDIL